jgi:hypothetical protein
MPGKPASPPQSDYAETPQTPAASTPKTTRKRTPPKKKRLRGNVFKRLRKDAEKTVRSATLRIAKALLKQTLLGDVKCAKLLFSLLEKNPNETTLPPFRDFARTLMGDVSWDPNNPEGLPEEDPAPCGQIDSAHAAPTATEPDESMRSTTPPPKLILPN